MSLTSLRRRVEDGVQQRLVPDLFVKAKVIHRRNWRECPCEWCEAKRSATAYLSVSPVGMGYYDRVNWRESNAIRVRARLAKLFDPPFEVPDEAS